MTDQFVGEIRMNAFGFAPKGWAQCNGQLLTIQQNTALFALIGTSYGGDGVRTFGLPDLRGRTPVDSTIGTPPPGLSPYVNGESGGSETVTLLSGQLPPHTHPVNVLGSAGDKPSAPNHVLAGVPTTATTALYATPSPAVPLASTTVLQIGGNQPHDNMQPFLTVNFCIALTGYFPSRN